MRRLLVLPAFVTSLQTATKDAAAEANAAPALTRAGKYELAIPRYRAAMALDPRLPGIHPNLGFEAAPSFESAAQADPGIRLARLHRGILLTDGEPQNAVTHFGEATCLEPARPDAHYRLIQLLLSIGRAHEANAEFARGKELVEKTESSAPLVKVASSLGEPKQ